METGMSLWKPSGTGLERCAAFQLYTVWRRIPVANKTYLTVRKTPGTYGCLGPETTQEVPAEARNKLELVEHKRLKTSKSVFFFLVYIWNKKRWKVCACSVAKSVRYLQMINPVFVLLRSLRTRVLFRLHRSQHREEKALNAYLPGCVG